MHLETARTDLVSRRSLLLAAPAVLVGMKAAMGQQIPALSGELGVTTGSFVRHLTDEPHAGKLQLLDLPRIMRNELDMRVIDLMTATLPSLAPNYLEAPSHRGGRISRGSSPGYLCVFANPASDEAEERLTAFTKTSDGFELADIDFRLRGPGDLFGTRQHGLPPLRIADLRRDIAVVEQARRDAQSLIESDPDLASPAFTRLRRMVFHRYGEALDLGDVG